MKKVNDRWVDNNNNSWSSTFNTEEQAIKKSETLINCRGCSDCCGCRDCSDCCDFRGCSGCRGCSDCSDCKTQPKIYKTKNIGSRKSSTTFFQNENGIFVVCGCFQGTFNSFIEKVKNQYPDKTNQHRIEYEKEIEIAKIIFK
ncbi:MAG: hypothetical protein LLG40_13895 [Deltaproteobacteria bacterium]|nr:hypothetical protein [Deltaproteobacteria bacterium]